MNNKTCKQFLALLLLFAMLVGFIPAISAPALAVAPPQITVTTEDELRTVLEKTSYTNIAIDDGGTEFTLTAPIEIDRNVNLQGLNRKTGDHQANRATVIKAVKGVFSGDTLFRIHNKDKRLEVTFIGLTIDVDNDTPPTSGAARKSRRAISVTNGLLQLGDSIKSNDAHCFPVTIQNGYVSGAGVGGGAVSASNSTVIARNVRFLNNEAAPGTASSGGAVYIGGGEGVFTQCDFRDNCAHSGGALYYFGGKEGLALYVDSCTFADADGSRGNQADQRGGAILSHGLAVINNTTIHGQKSGQFGGALYISASETLQGSLLLQNSVVEGNRAGSNGGGVYIADQGVLILAGEKTSVTENALLDAVVPTEDRWNNVFYATSSSKVIVASDTGKVGVSTVNPYTFKLAVRSAASERQGDGSFVLTLSLICNIINIK